jgi:probable HAF family extracellular repeat protein
MRFGTWSSVVALTLTAVLATPIRVAAQQDAMSNNAKHHHYQAIDMGTFGGPNSSYVGPPPSVRLLNNNGVAVGGSDTSTSDPASCWNFDCALSYGFKRQDGTVHRLDALPGFNSSFTFWVSDSGLVAGLSENGIDPLTGTPAQEAIVWGKDGSPTDLGTLGGNESEASAVNNRGEVAGSALNTIPGDPRTDIFFLPGATQVHAFRWTKSEGMQDLGTLGGTDSAAFFINERGQIAGFSFTRTEVNATGAPTLDPFFWENGKMLDLGTLGGTFGQAFALNNRGQVVGASNLAGDFTEHPFIWSKAEGMKDLGTLGGTFGFANYINDSGYVVGTSTPVGDPFGRAFLWRNGVMTNLGTLGDDPDSEAYGVNRQGQVVGVTGVFGVVDHLAFLWEHGGPMVDLNTLIPPNPDLQLTHALYINDRGEIAAEGSFPNGDIHALVLIPCDEKHPDVSGCDYNLTDASPTEPTAAPRSTPNSTQRPTRSWRSNRFRIPGRASGGGVAGWATTQVSPVSDVTRPPVFYVTASPLTPSSVNRGGSSTSVVTAYLTGGGAGTATLSCSVQPSPSLAPTCSISPTSVALGTPATLTVSTFGPSGRLRSHPGSGPLYALWLPLIGLVATGAGMGSRKNRQTGKVKTVALTCALLAGLTVQVACGGGGTSGTVAGSYTITVTATAFVPVNTSVTTLALQVN